MEAIVVEHQLEAFFHMKQALSAAIAAKEETISRDGYTPKQQPYGQEVRCPGLTDEEQRLSFAESIGTEGDDRCPGQAEKVHLLWAFGIITLNPKKKAPFLWTGLTILHRQKNHKFHQVYAELPGCFIEEKMQPEEAEEFRSLWCEKIRDLLVANALLLCLKENKKELGPKFFNSHEQTALDKADKEKWSEWADTRKLAM
eukprot:s3041_g9.t1